MGALLDDAALVQHDDAVSVPDGGEPVGDDERGSVVQQLPQGPLDHRLRAGVHVGGRLVQDEDAGIGQDRPGEAD